MLRRRGDDLAGRHKAYPMNHLELPIWRTVIAGYRDGIGALFRDGKLFRYFIYASALTLILTGGHLYLELGDSLISRPATSATQIGKLLLGLLISVVYAIATSPLTVALHRKLLLGETPDDAYLAAMVRGTQIRIAAVTMAVYGLFFVAQLSAYPIIYVAYGVNPLNAADLEAVFAAEPMIAFVIMALTWGASLFAGLVSTRFAFAFPAISTNAPGASLLKSYAETRGAMWRLFFIFLLILLPPFVAVVIAIGVASVLFVIGDPASMSDPDRVSEMMMLSPPFLVIYAIGFVLMMAIIVAIGAATARAYEIRVNRGMTGVAEVFA
jgi:hypothetical protein